MSRNTNISYSELEQLSASDDDVTIGGSYSSGRLLLSKSDLYSGSRCKGPYVVVAVVLVILTGAVIGLTSGIIADRALNKGKVVTNTNTNNDSKKVETVHGSGGKIHHDDKNEHLHSKSHVTNIKEHLVKQEKEKHVQNANSKIMDSKSKGQKLHNNREWSINLNGSGVESCVRTLDMDGDDLPDVLIGLTHAIDLTEFEMVNNDDFFEAYCKSKNLPSPCIGYLLALRGYDGKELWRIPTRSEVILMMCDLDLNGDGFLDCVVTGRQSIAQGVDVRHGKTLWYADASEYPTFFKRTWNNYQAVSIPDVDNDGVGDIVVPHGGDPNIDSEVHNRTAGRLIVLSGATGVPIGKYMEMPDDRETYMSLVKYESEDGSLYIVFGSGGETVPGDLMAITLEDLAKVTGQILQPESKGRDDWKNILETDSSGVMLIYRGDNKGIMVPPVFVDVNSDGVDDILVHVFEGKVVLLDGRTLTVLWEAEFPGMESYSTPAPGFYNEDECLDFMVHWSVGAWPTYNQSITYVINGKDGSILWTDSTSLYQMSSDLVLKSKTNYKDHFIVKMRGRRGNQTKEELHGVGVQRVINKRSSESYEEDADHACEEFKRDYENHKLSCNDNISWTSEEIYLVNRDYAKNIIPFHKISPSKLYYNIEPTADGTDCMKIDGDTGKIPFCITLTPNSRSTGSIADVDGDGEPDLIHLDLLEGMRLDSKYSYVNMEFTTIISRINIRASLHHEAASRDDQQQIEDITFAPMTSQPWTEYLGSKASSVYSQPIR